jgi:hypothetical protein
MSREDQVTAELGVLMDEYKVLKSEIGATLTTSRQMVGLTLTAAAALLAATPAIVDHERFEIFFFAPLVFCGLALTQLRYVFLVLDMGKYLRCSLAPEIRRALGDLAAENRDFEHILAWESREQSLPFRRRGAARLLSLPLAGANLGLPLLAGALSLTAYFYFYFEHESGRPPGWIVWTVAGAVVLALLSCLVLGFVAERER